jgi:hypothetical protein
MTTKGWRAWDALTWAYSGTLPLDMDKNHYVHAQWAPLYEAVTEGRLVAKGATASGGRLEDISDLFECDGMFVNAWADTMEAPGWGRFYDVRLELASAPKRRSSSKKKNDAEEYASYKKHAKPILADQKRGPSTKEDEHWRKGVDLPRARMRVHRNKFRKQHDLN